MWTAKGVEIKHPRDAVALGLGLVPEGRKEQGMFLKLDVRENMTLVNRRKMTRYLSVIDEAQVTKESEQVRKGSCNKNAESVSDIELFKRRESAEDDNSAVADE